MLPQAYPLVIEDEHAQRWLVIGWRDYNPTLRPVVLPAPENDDATDEARELPRSAGHFVVIPPGAPTT